MRRADIGGRKSEGMSPMRAVHHLALDAVVPSEEFRGFVHPACGYQVAYAGAADCRPSTCTASTTPTPKP